MGSGGRQLLVVNGSATFLRHLLSAKNVTDVDVRVPEYVRRILNDVPSGYRRRISYTLQVGF